MTRRTPIALAGVTASLGFAALSLGLPGARAGQARPATPPDAVQVIADVVLIEAVCRQVNVDYGKLFAYAQRNGVEPVDVMPLGGRRAAFDADYRRRARDAREADLCGPLAAEREADVPGVFTTR